MAYTHIVVETRGPVGLLTLNRPESLNALSTPLMRELAHALDAFESDGSVRAIVLTSSDRAFAAGADVKEMQPKTFSDVYAEDFITAEWERLSRCRKPVIAAVAGFALGGGCELAMMCDVIVAADTAQFGQPEAKLGIIPGFGGTQRLTRLVGKAKKAMDMCLTGRKMGAEEAERAGLVAASCPPRRCWTRRWRSPRRSRSCRWRPS